MPTRLTVRVTQPAVALETTLLVHGVPRDAAGPLAAELASIVRAGGAHSALVGVVRGEPIVGMTDRELRDLLETPGAPKANTANLGVLLHWGASAATTVSATMELAAAAGVRVFATGGVGGVHPDLACRLDASSDLAAFTRFPVAVVSSGVKAILDVESTREAFETLGAPVVGFRTDSFPAFYLRSSGAGVDARFDEVEPLAAFVKAELERTGRGVLIANPIEPAHEIGAASWRAWLDEAEDRAEAAGVVGRDVTPFLLGALHEVSGGRTLAANIELVKSNAALAARLAASMGSS